MFRNLLLILIAIPPVAVANDNEANSGNVPTGDLVITFKFKGKRPDPKPLELPASCGSLKMFDESLIVNGNNNGIMNVIVYAHQDPEKDKLPAHRQRNKLLNLACWNCRLVPRITTAQVGDRLKVRNMDPVGYNVNINFFRNEGVNLAMASGRQETITLEKSEPGVIPVACHIFPWMVSYLLVVDHPFYGKTNPDGKLVIRGLPSGKKMTFRAWHERGSFKNEIYVNGKQTRWTSNKFDVEIKPGINNLGVVEISGTEFR